MLTNLYLFVVVQLPGLHGLCGVNLVEDLFYFMKQFEAHCFLFLFIYLFRACVCVWFYFLVHDHTDVRGQFLVSPLMALRALFFETGSPTETGIHQFNRLAGQHPPGSAWLQAPLLPVPAPQAHATMPGGFVWVLKTQTKVLMFTQQFSLLMLLPSSRLFFFKGLIEFIGELIQIFLCW